MIFKVLNFVSFQDTGVDQALDQARVMPDCRPEPRAGLYRDVQARVEAAVPYVWLNGAYAGWSIAADWQNVRPGAWQTYTDVHRWQPAAR